MAYSLLKAQFFQVAQKWVAAGPRRRLVVPSLILIPVILSTILWFLYRRSEERFQVHLPAHVASERVTPESLLQKASQGVSRAPGIPRKIPDYSIERSTFSSVQSGIKQWKLKSKRSNLFSSEKLVHATQIQAELFDGDNDSTFIVGNEARYFLDQQDLEIFGDVVTSFPDGFVLRSQYLRYRPKSRWIEIPVQEPVHGESGPPPTTSKRKPASGGDDFTFDSRGFTFSMESSVIQLPRSVRFFLKKKPTSPQQTKSETTEVRSDSATIFRTEDRVEFKMSPFQLPSTRFVTILQPDLYARSRWAEMFYGANKPTAETSTPPADQTRENGSAAIRYMTAHQDVLIKEKQKNSKDDLRYSTSGRADFDNEQDLIYLTDLPQVYQGRDTMTGDRVILHKASDLVEVENSNAYNDSKKSP